MTHVRTQSQGTRIALGGVYSLFVTLTAGLALAVPSGALAAITCARTVTADVVVFDQPLMYNRLGAQNVNGIMYALRRDVVSKGSLTPCGAACVAGNVTLRPDKRPRPLVLRVAAGDCLEVKFQNLLTALANPSPATPGFNLPKVDDQVASRKAGFHAQGMQLVNVIGDDSSWVGASGSSLVGPGRRRRHLQLLRREGGGVPRHQPRRDLRKRRVGGQQRERHVRGDQRRAARRELLPQPGDRGGDAPLHHRDDRRRPAHPELPGDLSGRRRHRRGHGVGARGQGRPARPQHAAGHDARPLRPERRHRRIPTPSVPTGQVPRLHLSAGERRQGEPDRSQPARALPRVHGGLPRRDGGLERLPGVVPPPGPQAHPRRRAATSSR